MVDMCVFLQDISGRVIAEGLRPGETNAAKVMTRDPVFVMSNSSATEALQKMVQGLIVIFLQYQN
jgi:CBS domain-containing protein